MTQEMAVKLMDSEYGKQLVSFIASECLKLDTVDGIDVMDKGPFGVAVEVAGRKLAIKTLKGILEPLLLVNERGKIIVSKDEYVA